VFEFDCYYLRLEADGYVALRGIYVDAHTVQIDPRPRRESNDTLAKTRQALSGTELVIYTRRHQGNVVIVAMPEKSDMMVDEFIELMEDYYAQYTSGASPQS
jgi:hypothetical protein